MRCEKMNPGASSDATGARACHACEADRHESSESARHRQVFGGGDLLNWQAARLMRAHPFGLAIARVIAGAAFGEGGGQ